MTFWTSEYLVEKLGELKDEDVLIELAEEGHGISDEQERFEKLALALISRSLGTPLPKKLRAPVGHLRGYKGALEGFIDECLCRDFLQDVRHMVQRARWVAPLFVDETPEPVVADMWWESVRSYIYGHFQASVALSRATIEHALRAALESKGVRLTEESTLETFIDGAYKYRVLSEEAVTKAHSVRRVANKVLHETTTDASVNGALEILERTRAGLEELYAA